MSRLRDKLILQVKVWKQLDDIRRQERALVGAQFEVKKAIEGIQERMERACLYQTLADTYARMVVRPTHSPSDRPLNLQPCSPLEMPQLHDEPRHCGCWECGSFKHRRKQCPECQHPPWQCTYCQSYSHWSLKCLFKRLALLPPPTRTIEEGLSHHNSVPKWCGKCLCNNPSHEEVDCPTRELCCNCRRWGNLFFLRTHKCDDNRDQLMYGEENEVADPSLYGDGES